MILVGTHKIHTKINMQKIEASSLRKIDSRTKDTFGLKDLYEHKDLLNDKELNILKERLECFVPSARANSESTAVVPAEETEPIEPPSQIAQQESSMTASPPPLEPKEPNEQQNDQKEDFENTLSRNKQNNEIKINDKNGQDKHIFRNKEGHLSDTPENRQLLKDVASDINNRLDIDSRGNEWYVKILSDGKQVWAVVRNNVIRNGGINDIPRPFNKQTGLSKNIGTTWNQN